MISDLPRDVAEEVLSRLPMKSMRAMRLTCKNWNKLSKSRRFIERHVREIKAASDFMVVISIGFRLHLASINLDKGLEPSINFQGKVSDGLDVFRVCQCNGLLLCILNERTLRMVVCNPYLGQTRLLKPITYDDHSDYRCKFAIGYDQRNKSNYKILRFLESSPDDGWYEVYYLNKFRNDTIPVTFFPDWEIIDVYRTAASVKGNTYWFATEKTPRGEYGEYVEINGIDFLICFDFTRERFGPRLSLPFHSYFEDCVTLHSVRDEQLAVLYQPHEEYSLEIWISNKIETDEVSWDVFLAVDLTPFPNFYNIAFDAGSFFVDEEKKLAVVFNKRMAYFVGEGGRSLKIMDSSITPTSSPSYNPVISYVPSLAQIKQHA